MSAAIVTVAPFRGGRGAVVGGLAAGLLGALLTVLGWWIDPRQAAFSWLTAFAYFVGIAVCALILLLIFHAASARWMVVLRRLLEGIATAVPVFVLLFLPIAAGLGLLFVWVEIPPGMPEEQAHHLHHKQAWHNPPLFLLRTAVYFGIWIGVGELLRRWSIRQDRDRGTDLTLRQRRFAGPAIPFLGVSLTFAAFDWLMSLQPLWYSTIFGVYYFAGSFVSVLALLIVVLHLWRGPGSPATYFTPSHWHSLGKLLLGFVVFWAYIAFSQFMLIWIANLPEEAPWYLLRSESGWKWFGVFLMIGHFAVPFFALLSRRLKRTPGALAMVAGWILVAHYVDLYWIVMPVLHVDGPAPHWTDLAAPLGVGGFALAFTVWRMRGHYPMPVGDPYLPQSMRYHP